MSAKGTIHIEKWDTSKDGVLNEQNMEKKIKSQGYNFTKYEFCPGTDFPDHTHTVSKKDSVLTGKFQVSMYGEAVVLGPGDMIEVPKNTVHNASVVGHEPVVFYAAEK